MIDRCPDSVFRETEIREYTGWFLLICPNADFESGAGRRRRKMSLHFASEKIHL